MPAVFFLNKLHPHVSPADYEEWVRTVDYPTARALPSIQEYTVCRIEGLLEGTGDAPYQYIERVLITDFDSYLHDLQSPDLSNFSEQWSSYVADSTAVRSTMVE